MNSNVIIVIPTYKEYQNLVELIPSISSEYDILIVDDYSDDGTENYILSLDRYNKSIFYLKRLENNGLTRAYIDGFKWVINSSNKKYECIVQMDGDGFHKPSEIHKLVEEVKKGNDLVLGSRWMNNSTINSDWPTMRRILSTILNKVLRLIINKNILDVSTGFRAMTFNSLSNINLDSICSNYFGIQEELLYLYTINNYKISEISISFGNRIYGKSKLNFKTIFELCKLIFIFLFLKMRFKIFKK